MLKFGVTTKIKSLIRSSLGLTKWNYEIDGIDSFYKQLNADLILFRCFYGVHVQNIFCLFIECTDVHGKICQFPFYDYGSLHKNCVYVEEAGSGKFKCLTEEANDELQECAANCTTECFENQTFTCNGICIPVGTPCNNVCQAGMEVKTVFDTSYLKSKAQENLYY